MHRGLGHNIFIGWLLKALYILLILIIICIIILALGYNIYTILDYIDIKIIGAFLIGLFLSNGVHIITDKMA